MLMFVLGFFVGAGVMIALAIVLIAVGEIYGEVHQNVIEPDVRNV